MDNFSPRLTQGQSSKRSIDWVEGGDDEGRRKKKSRMEEKIDLLLKGQDDIKRELGARIDGLEGQVKTVSKRVDNVDETIIMLNQRIHKVESWAKNGNGELFDSPSVSSYWKARRSIRVGPSGATNKQEAMVFLRDLLVNEMKLPSWEVESMRVADVNLVVRHNRAKAQDFTMILITFEEVAHRDRVFSKVSGLPKELKMEIVVPNHLITKFKKLEKLAYDLRQDNRKTLIRYDDTHQTLVLIAREKVDGAKWNEVSMQVDDGDQNKH